MKILLNNSFHIKLSKCSFSQKDVEYLCHIISKECVQVNSKKIKTIQTWPKPNSITQLRRFLIFTGYYQKFVKNYASIVKPLTNMFKKNAFTWSIKSDQAFEYLKKAMTITHMLVMLNFEKTFKIYSNASNVGVGAVLVQEEDP